MVYRIIDHDEDHKKYGKFSSVKFTWRSSSFQFKFSAKRRIREEKFLGK